jgi:hypothetical protein
MKCPKFEAVEKMDRKELFLLQKALVAPGLNLLGAALAGDASLKDFDAVLLQEKMVMKRIQERFKELGGMDLEFQRELGFCR